MAPRYGNKQQVKGGVLKRAKRRARKQGREGLLKDGVTGAEARKLRKGYERNRNKKKGVGGPVAKRAKERLEQIGPVGGVNAKDGISRPEARKVRKAWQTERRHDPLRPRNGRDLLAEGNALVDLEYAGEERELARSRRNEQGRQQVMGSWFQDYQNKVAQMARDTQIANAAFQSGAAQAAQQAFQMDTAGVGQRQTQAGQQAAQFGAQADPNVAMQAQQAAGGRLAQGTAFAGTMGQIGQAQSGLMGQLGINAGQQRMEVLADSDARLGAIDRLAQELAGEKGQALTKTMGGLKDQERQYALERSAFNLDVEQERFDQSDARADNKRAARKDRQQAARDRLLNRSTRMDIRKKKGEVALDRQADLADDGRRNHSTDYDEWAQRTRPDSDGGGADSFTPTQVRDNRSSFENGRDIAYRYRDKGYDWLVSNMTAKNYDALMAKVIAHKATRKRIPRSLLNRFERRYGFRPSAKGKGRPGQPQSIRPQTGTPVG
jgi:hypothetical protein